jgi:hypothetical protein
MAAATKPDVPVAETPEVAATPVDVATRIERAAALARVNAPLPIPAVPVEDPLRDEVGHVWQPPRVPMIPKSTAFSGTTHIWAGGGQPYRVIEPSFPWIVDGLYRVATFGDVVVIDEKAAEFGLQFASIEPID